MPIYEYSCLKCDTKFEKLVLKSDTPIECPKCHAAETKKLFSAFGFKSSGTYTSSTGGDSCSSCGSHHCSTCGGH
ncbi:zinc ribbon domain-containing protein [bacterium]|nr:zinc ribbon domain-containing protein [bacterium]